MTSTSNQPDTIVLIPGLWLSATSWEHWVERYQNKGFEALARNWPGLEGEIQSLREDASSVDDVGFDEVVDHFEKLVRPLDRPPIIMGHSFGGSIVEILLDRGVGAVGVAIDPGPIKGVLKLPFSELKSASPGLRNPKKPPPRCDADTRRVPLRVHEHPDRSRVCGNVRALRDPRARQGALSGGVRKLPSTLTDQSRLPQRRPSAAAVDRR